MHLSELIRYPLKSCRAEQLTESLVGRRGLAGDRRWMVIDAEGRFMSARKTPALLTVRVETHTAGGIRLSAETHGHCEASCQLGGPLLSATVWGDTVMARQMRGANEWLSQLVGEPARLVYMHDACQRPVDPESPDSGDLVSFADGYPLLVTNQSSLDDLNARLDVPVPMGRFRPNLVITGAQPFEELSWARIRIGEIEFVSGGPCVRCVMTTRDPMTGATDGSGEPLKTLSTYQRTDAGVLFGMNLIPRQRGVLEVGQTVEVLERA